MDLTSNQEARIRIGLCGIAFQHISEIWIILWNFKFQNYNSEIQHTNTLILTTSQWQKYT